MTNLTPKKGNPPADWPVRFLDALAEYGNVSAACRVAKVSRETVYRHKREDATFALAWDEAAVLGVESLEDEARRRAFKGVRKPVYQKGELVGYVQEYSDTLMIFLLKAHKPEKYRERHEFSGPNGGPIPIQHSADDEQLDSYLVALAQISVAKAAPSGTNNDVA